MNYKKGFSLIEVLMVIIIMAILSGVAYQSMESISQAADYAEAKDELQQIKYGIIGNPNITSGGKRPDLGFYGKYGRMPKLWDEFAKYLGIYPTEIIALDPWGEKYDFKNLNGSNPMDPVIFFSTHDPSQLQEIIIPQYAMLVKNLIKGKITDWYGATPASNDLKNIKITARNVNTGSTQTVNPDADGTYTIKNIKVGYYEVTCVHSSHSNELIKRLVTIGPGETGYADFRFNFTLPGTEPPSGYSYGGLEYVANSASVPYGGTTLQYGVRFRVKNTSNSNINITYTSATYIPNKYGGQDIYYKRVYANGSQRYYNFYSGKIYSGDQTNWTSSITLHPNEIATITLWTFKTDYYNISMKGSHFKVLFNDGSFISFSIPD